VQKVSQLTQSQAEQLEIDLVDLLARGKVADSMARGAQLTAGQHQMGGDFRPQEQEPAAGQAAVPAPVSELAEHIGGTLSREPPREKQPSVGEVQPCPPVTPERLERIKSLMPLAFGSQDESVAAIRPLLGQWGVQKIPQINCAQADVLISKLNMWAEARRANAGQQQAADATAGAPDANAPDSPGTITKEQLMQIKLLSEQTGWTHDEQAKWLAPLGAQTFRSISFNQAAGRINELVKIKDSFGGGVPGN
jgi:hypothetical protein